MINDPLTLEKAAQILTEITKQDPEAMRALCDHRISCNNTLADHPTVQVGEYDGIHKVGLLGILNGLFGTFDSGKREGWGPSLQLFKRMGVYRILKYWKINDEED